MIATYVGRVVRHQTYRKADGSEGLDVVCTPADGDGKWDDSIGWDAGKLGRPAVGDTIAVRLLIRPRLWTRGQEPKAFLNLWALDAERVPGTQPAGV